MRDLRKIILFEASVWYALPAVFLIAYVGNYHHPVQGAYWHLYLITLIALSAILLKLLLYALTSKVVAAPITAFIYTSALLTLGIYYCLVIIGLKSWGRVITKELIISYASQASMLLNQLSISLGTVLFGLVIGFSGLFAALFYFADKYSVSTKVSVKLIHPWLINLSIFSTFLLTAYYLNDYLVSPNLSAQEPLHLTLHAGKSNLISHKIHADSLLDKQENEAVAKYRVANNHHKRNVILIVVDALRPDHMGVYGYERDTTPYLSELNKLGRLTKLSNVRASCGESACGLASIASSRYVHQMPTTPITLQQILQLQGYKTNMILGGDHTNFYNLKNMYGKVDSYFDGSMAKKVYMNDDTLVVEKTKDLPVWNGVPSLFQFHLMSTHTLGKRLERFEKFKPSKGYAGITESAPKQEYTNYYDNGVLQADGIIQELLDLLATKNYLKDALIVITADHGESLGEHNLLGHASSVHEEQLRVPLLFIDLDKSTKLSKSTNQFASQVDIAPTILQNLNISIPSTWRGEPIELLSVLNRKLELTFFQMHGNVGLYDHRQPNSLWKYWINLHSNQEFAFNLTSDAQESNNLISTVPITIRNEWHKLAYSMKLKAPEQ